MKLPLKNIPINAKTTIHWDDLQEIAWSIYYRVGLREMELYMGILIPLFFLAGFMLLDYQSSPIGFSPGIFVVTIFVAIYILFYFLGHTKEYIVYLKRDLQKRDYVSYHCIIDHDFCRMTIPGEKYPTMRIETDKIDRYFEDDKFVFLMSSIYTRCCFICISKNSIPAWFYQYLRKNIKKY